VQLAEEMEGAGRELDGSALAVRIERKSGDLVERGLEGGRVVGSIGRRDFDACGYGGQSNTAATIAGVREVRDVVAAGRARVDETAIRIEVNPAGLARRRGGGEKQESERKSEAPHNGQRTPSEKRKARVRLRWHG
jgi:hypothetical protein